MAILIKDLEADRVVRDMAEHTGETITEAVRKAAEERMARLRPKKKRIDGAKLGQAQAYFASLQPLNEGLMDEEIVGYNEEGHFG
jgi:antitoxin VapB